MAEVFLCRTPAGKVLLAAVGDDARDALTSIHSLSLEALERDLAVTDGMAAANGPLTLEGRLPVPKRKREPHGGVEFTMRGFAVPPPLLGEWVAAYPLVNVAAEVMKAHSWVVSGWPGTRKSKWGSFLNNWMARTQEIAERENPQSTTDPIEQRNREYARKTHGV